MNRAAVMQNKRTYKKEKECYYMHVLDHEDSIIFTIKATLYLYAGGARMKACLSPPKRTA